MLSNVLLDTVYWKIKCILSIQYFLKLTEDKKKANASLHLNHLALMMSEYFLKWLCYCPYKYTVLSPLSWI